MNRLILFGHNDTGMLGEGWYGVERAPEGILYRAMQPRAVLDAPVNKPLHMTLYCSSRAQDSGEPLCVHIGEENTRIELSTNGWTTRTLTVTPSSDGHILLTVENPWSPDAIYRNGDARSLGALISSVRFEPLRG